MAKKKSKRPNLSQETLERARAELRGDFVEPVPAAPAVGNGTAVVESKAKAAKRNPALATRRIPSTDELVAEYGYVLRDLRNLAILAVALLAIIIVAAVVLPRPTG
jgi:hypothetical protein